MSISMARRASGRPSVSFASGMSSHARMRSLSRCMYTHACLSDDCAPKSSSHRVCILRNRMEKASVNTDNRQRLRTCIFFRCFFISRSNFSRIAESCHAGDTAHGVQGSAHSGKFPPMSSSCKYSARCRRTLLQACEYCGAGTSSFTCLGACARQQCRLP